MPTNHAEGILERAANPSKTYCQWCKHPDEPIRRGGLCSHCYRLKLKAAACERQLAAFIPGSDSRVSKVERCMLERAVKVASKMIELAKHEGDRYARFAEPASGLEVEMELSFICQNWLGRNLFYGWANDFDWSFDETQKRLLLYIFCQMKIEYLREQRRKIAEAIVFREERDGEGD
jgi:hypothetical protein